MTYAIVVYKARPEAGPPEVKETLLCNLDEVMEFIQDHRDDNASTDGRFSVHKMDCVMDYS